MDTRSKARLGAVSDRGQRSRREADLARTTCACQISLSFTSLGRTLLDMSKLDCCLSLTFGVYKGREDWIEDDWEKVMVMKSRKI